MHNASGNARLLSSINSDTVARPPQPHCEQQRQKPNETQDPINSNTVARQSQSQCNRQRQKLNDSTELEKLEYRRALTATAMQAATPEISERAEQPNSNTFARASREPNQAPTPSLRFVSPRAALLCFALFCLAWLAVLCLS